MLFGSGIDFMASLVVCGRPSQSDEAQAFRDVHVMMRSSLSLVLSVGRDSGWKRPGIDFSSVLSLQREAQSTTASWVGSMPNEMMAAGTSESFGVRERTFKLSRGGFNASPGSMNTQRPYYHFGCGRLTLSDS